MWSRSELKARAKEVLKHNYWMAVLVSIIFGYLSGGGGNSAGSAGVSSGADNSGNFGNVLSDPKAIAYFLTAFSVMIIIFLLIFAVFIVINIFVFNPIIVGCHRFFIQCGKGTSSLNDVVYVFSHSYLNVVKIMFFMNLYTALWSLLLIIPGIVKGYEYQMIPYLLAENPSLSKDEAFALTKQMMTGDKMNAFVLDLSFLGWILLGLLTCCILNLFYVAPYQNLTNAELYGVLKQKIGGTPWERQQAAGSSQTSQNPYLR